MNEGANSNMAELAEVTRSVDQLSGKLDTLSELMDERMKAIERRIDQSAREQQQATRLLSEAIGKLEAMEQKTASDLNDERVLGTRLRTQFDDFKEKVEKAQENMHNNIRSIVQVIVGGGVTLAASVIGIYLTKVHGG